MLITFLSLFFVIINIVNKNFNNKPPIEKDNQKKIQISESTKELITFEDLQTQRLNDFDKQLAKKQQEFTNAITLQIPEAPNFKDESDGPLTEIEKEVKKMMEQRNYDIERISKSFNGENGNWLKPMETSIKNDKEKVNQNQQTNQINLLFVSSFLIW